MVKNLPANARDAGNLGLILGSGRSPGGGNSNPCQYSCLENFMDRGDWWATLHGVTELDTTEHTCAHTHIHTYTLSLSLSPYHNIAQLTPSQSATLKQIPHPNYFLLSPLLKFELRHNHLLPESIILLTNFPASFLPPIVCFPYSSQGVHLQVKNESQCCST